MKERKYFGLGTESYIPQVMFLKITVQAHILHFVVI